MFVILTPAAFSDCQTLQLVGVFRVSGAELTVDCHQVDPGPLALPRNQPRHRPAAMDRRAPPTAPSAVGSGDGPIPGFGSGTQYGKVSGRITCRVATSASPAGSRTSTQRDASGRMRGRAALRPGIPGHWCGPCAAAKCETTMSGSNRRSSLSR